MDRRERDRREELRGWLAGHVVVGGCGAVFNEEKEGGKEK